MPGKEAGKPHIMPARAQRKRTGGSRMDRYERQTIWHVCAALRPAVQKKYKDPELPEKDR
jgi:hypothetical protein